jgi:hypothetical protein
VSLLSVNQLLAVLSRDYVAAVSRSTGIISRQYDQKSIFFSQPVSVVNEQMPIWSVMISQFDDMLASMQIKPKSQLHITLASCFIRYMALPPLLMPMSQAEKLAYATATYRETYGAVVDEWEIKLRDTPIGHATIVAAVDKKLLDALRRIALKHQLKMTSVQPYVMTVFNRLSRSIGQVSGYLVIVECNRLLLIDLEKGACQHLRTFTLGSDWQAELNSILMRERLLTERSYRQVLVYAPKQMHVEMHDIKEWQLKRISLPKNKLVDHRIAMLEVLL